MALTWFCLIGLLLTVYVVLDGFDLGVGALHLLVARQPKERAACIRSVGPVWDGNEVWLIAAGGTLFFAFPPLYARSFSGFYLPLILVLWLLTGRALAIELRHQVQSRLWREAWDVVFAGSSTALAFVLGAALANLVRGVPLGPEGTFFVPFFTDFTLGPKPGVLDWYSLLTGVAAVVALAHHGTLWLAFRVQGEVRARARRLQRPLWVAALVGAGAVSAATLYAQPQALANLRAHPWGVVLPVLSLGALVAVFASARAGRYRAAFLGSAAHLAALLASAAFAIYPYALPACDPRFGLLLSDAATPDSSLRRALWWWIPALLLAVGYSAFVYSRLPESPSPPEASDRDGG